MQENKIDYKLPKETKNPLVIQDQEHELLLQRIDELNSTIKKMESDIEDIKYFTPTHRPVIDKETIGTIGGILLGALAIIGIFF